MDTSDGRVADTVQQRARRLHEDWVALREELRRTSASEEAIEELAKVVERALTVALKGVGVALTTFASTLLQDTDRKERLRIHGLIGDVLAAECHLPTGTGMVVAYYLMSPEDVADLAVNGQMPAPPAQELLTGVSKILLGVTLRYEKRPASYTSSTAHPRSREKSRDVFVSVIELYLLRGASPVRTELTNEIDPDYMLSSAREDWLRTRQPVAYKVFPRRAGS